MQINAVQVETPEINNNAEKYGLLEQILSPENLKQAYLRVLRDKGTEESEDEKVRCLIYFLVDHEEELITSILNGTYNPEENVPAVVDRVIQQAMAQALTPIFEQEFSDHSYPIRSQHNAHDALLQSVKYINEGYVYAVDMELEKFFDSVDHNKLVRVISETIKDDRVVSLINKYLNAKVLTSEGFKTNELGVPVAGPLSPLLGNIILNELDKELDKRGYKYVRYAGDILILCKSLKCAERVRGSTVAFIDKELLHGVKADKQVKEEKSLNQAIKEKINTGKAADVKLPDYFSMIKESPKQNSTAPMINYRLAVFQKLFKNVFSYICFK